MAGRRAVARLVVRIVVRAVVRYSSLADEKRSLRHSPLSLLTLLFH